MSQCLVSHPLTLMLCAAEQRIMFGLAQAGVLLSGQDFAAASQGAELLAPALNSMLKLLKKDISSVERVACVTGPGSFTGVRLVLTTASALHHSLNIPLGGINYLELLAESAPAQKGESVRVITHARRDLVHWQNFTRDDNGVQACGEACVGSPTEAASEPVTGDLTSLVLVGSGVAKYRDVSDEHMPGTRVYSSGYDQPDWYAFMRLAERAKYKMQDLEPFYLRASEAEDNLEMLAERRGENPITARSALEYYLKQEPDSLC